MAESLGLTSKRDQVKGNENSQIVRTCFTQVTRRLDTQQSATYGTEVSRHTEGLDLVLDRTKINRALTRALSIHLHGTVPRHQ